MAKTITRAQAIERLLFESYDESMDTHSDISAEEWFADWTPLDMAKKVKRLFGADFDNQIEMMIEELTE